MPVLLTTKPRLKKLKARAPQLLVVAIVVIVVAIVVFETLEDILIDGGTFSGTPLAVLFNFIVAFTQDVTATVSSWGYIGVFVLMFLESTSLPIPSEVILPFSGYLVSKGQLNIWLTILISTVAGTSGSLVDYFIGMKGMDFLAQRKVLNNLFFDKVRLETAQNLFEKYGGAAVFLSRLIPGFRTLVSFPAGAVRMQLTKFIVYTTAGCLIWSTLLIYLGAYVGANWREVAGISRYLIIGFLVAILLVFIVFLIRRKKAFKK
jgi:membrane protein DedA with SNARE-associated domain